MRCPKCGFISFDRQKSCGKCTADLTAVAEQLRGTVSKAATPFFLGAALGKQTLDDTKPSSPDLHEEEDSLDLDELEADAPPAGEDELDFAGAPLDEDELAEPILPSLGLEDIDVSDLVPAQEDEEAPVLSLGDEQEEELLAPVPSEEAEEELTGIEFSGFDSDEPLAADENETPLDDNFEDEAVSSQNNPEDEEIIDLSSLMDFDETPATQAEQQEDHDVLELSLGDEPEELHLSIEEDAAHTADASKKPTDGAINIADLGLTLENDDH